MEPRVDTFEFLGMKAVVASEGLRDALHKAARVAGSEASVLITGESGSGKELIARAIHHFSRRCDKAMGGPELRRAAGIAGRERTVRL